MTRLNPCSDNTDSIQQSPFSFHPGLFPPLFDSARLSVPLISSPFRPRGNLFVFLYLFIAPRITRFLSVLRPFSDGSARLFLRRVQFRGLWAVSATPLPPLSLDLGLLYRRYGALLLSLWLLTRFLFRWNLTGFKGQSQILLVVNSLKRVTSEYKEY